jgi:hypothetical protein
MSRSTHCWREWADLRADARRRWHLTQSIACDLYGNSLSIMQSGLYGIEGTKTQTYDAYHACARP